MGGLMYSNNFTGSYTQVTEWTKSVVLVLLIPAPGPFDIIFLSSASLVVMPSVWRSATLLVPMPRNSVNTSTTVSAVPIMLLTLLMTKSLKPALLKMVITQASTPQTVSSKPILNRPSPSVLLLRNHTVFAFPLPPTVKLSLVQPCFLAYLLRLLRLLPPGPRDNLEHWLVLLDLLKVLLLMQLALPFLASRLLLVSPLLLFSCHKE